MLPLRREDRRSTKADFISILGLLIHKGVRIRHIENEKILPVGSNHFPNDLIPEVGIGHPWEVVRGGNSTHVDLYVQQDEYGYHFHVAGDHRRGEAIRFYLAIRQAGLPVSIRHGCLLADILRGADTIGIVPEGVIPRYCEWRFPGEQTIDFMRPMDDELEKMQDAIAWQPIPEVRLIQEGR